MPAEPLATLQNALLPGLVQRLTLLLNHVLRGEPAATARLVPHAGKRIELQVTGVPAWWPVPPLGFEVTRAGLLDADPRPHGTAAELDVTLDLSRPFDAVADWLGGRRPALSIRGDAGFATDVSWLVEHLRWDVEDDLERLFGPVAAHRMARTGGGVAAAVREMMAGLASLRR